MPVGRFEEQQLKVQGRPVHACLRDDLCGPEHVDIEEDHAQKQENKAELCKCLGYGRRVKELG